MGIWQELESRLAWFPWYRRRAREADLARELRDHLELEAEEQRARGLPPREALHAAHRVFGNTLQIEEDVRAVWTVVWIEQFWRDVRFGCRQWLRSPGLSAVIVFSLLLGIGANTAIFSLIDAILLRNLPVKSPQRLVLIEWAGGGVPVNETGPIDPPHPVFSYALYERFRAASRSLADIFADAPAGTLTVRLNGRVSLAEGEMVTGQFFPALGVPPLLGRQIEPGDVRGDGRAVAEISYPYWTKQFARSPSVVGQTLALNGVLYTIIGVMPKGFFGVELADSPDLWIPLTQNAHMGPMGSTAERGRPLFEDVGHWWLWVMARLKPGVTREQLGAALAVPFAQGVAAMQTAPIKPNRMPRLIVAPGGRGQQDVTRYAFEPFLILWAIVGLLLLAACANVAALLLARSAARRKEIAIRLSLGASRGRLILQLVTECVLLAATGGAAGLAAAYWAARALGAWIASGAGVAVTWNVQPDAYILAVTAAISIGAGIVFGLAPAFSATRVDVTPALKESARIASGGRRRQGGFSLGKGWVVAQVAIALVLLVGAGLLVQTLNYLVNQDLGFNPRHVLTFTMDPSREGYTGAKVTELYDRMMDRIQALPGVDSATYSTMALLGGSMNGGGVSPANGEIESHKPHGEVLWNVVGPNFAKTMQMKLVLGRDIGPGDTGSAAHVAVVNQAVARAFWGQENPIGREIRLGFGAGTYRVVGVTANAKYVSVQEQPPPTVYFPLPQTPWAGSGVTWEVRTTGRAAALAPAAREVVSQLAPGVPLSAVGTQSTLVAQSAFAQQMFANLSSFFSLLALLLAAIGLNGVVSYAVKRRTNEIGIRMALGATRADILAMVLKETVWMVAIGLAIGIPAAVGVARLAKGLFYGVSATDPTTIAVAALTLVGVALLSGYLPGRRAMKIEPTEALRYE